MSIAGGCGISGEGWLRDKDQSRPVLYLYTPISHRGDAANLQMEPLDAMPAVAADDTIPAHWRPSNRVGLHNKGRHRPGAGDRPSSIR